MLKKIIAFILVFVFCLNPLCLAANELDTKDKLNDKNTDIELIQSYAKIPPEDVEVWEDAVNSGLIPHSKKNLDKISKPLDCMDNRKNGFILKIDEKNTETKLRENFNRLSEIYQAAYNVFDESLIGDKEVLDYYQIEALKVFFKRFPNADNMTLDEFKTINELGAGICVFVNKNNFAKNNFEFIKTVLENPNSDMKQLSDVISLVQFDTKPSEKFIQAFDKGYISSILLSLPFYQDNRGNYRQEKIKLSELEDYLTLADSLEQNQTLNTEQINDILSFNLNVEYKTKIVKKAAEKKELTPEKKHEIIHKKMEKKAKSYTRNSDIKKTFESILIAPFMLVLILIPPIPFGYSFYCENVLNDIETKGFSKPYIIVDTIVLGLGALSPFNLPVLIEYLRHRK